MVIEPGNNSINSLNSSSGKAREKSLDDSGSAASKTDGAQPASSRDSVSLSSASLTISKIEAEISKTPDVDSARVAEVKATLESGRYQIDPQNLADKIALDESILG